MLRRSFLQGLGALFVAPAIVRAESLMPIKEYMPAVPVWCPDGWLPLDGREISKKFYPDLHAAYQRLRFHINNLPDENALQAASPHYSEDRLYGDLHPATLRRVISYKNFKRSNGKIMYAGAYCGIIVQPGED